MLTYYIAYKPYRKRAFFIGKIQASSPNVLIRKLIEYPAKNIIRAYNSKGELVAESFRSEDFPARGLHYIASPKRSIQSGWFDPKTGKGVQGIYGPEFESWTFIDGQIDGGTKQKKTKLAPIRNPILYPYPDGPYMKKTRRK